MTAAAAGTPVPPRAAPTRRRVLAVAVTITIAGLGLALTLPRVGASATTGFHVVDRPSGQVLFSRELAVGESFRLEHTHSVTGRDVVETFSVYDPDTLALEELVFDEFGPNLPAGPAHVGEHATFERDGDVYRVHHHGHPIGSVPLMVGSPAVDHALVFEDGTDLRLLDVADAGTQVELTTGTAPG